MNNFSAAIATIGTVAANRSSPHRARTTTTASAGAAPVDTTTAATVSAEYNGRSINGRYDTGQSTDRGYDNRKSIDSESVAANNEYPEI